MTDVRDFLLFLFLLLWLCCYYSDVRWNSDLNKVGHIVPGTQNVKLLHTLPYEERKVGAKLYLDAVQTLTFGFASPKKKAELLKLNIDNFVGIFKTTTESKSKFSNLPMMIDVANKSPEYQQTLEWFDSQLVKCRSNDMKTLKEQGYNKKQLTITGGAERSLNVYADIKMGYNPFRLRGISGKKPSKKNKNKNKNKDITITTTNQHVHNNSNTNNNMDYKDINNNDNNNNNTTIDLTGNVKIEPTDNDLDNIDMDNETNNLTPGTIVNLNNANNNPDTFTFGNNNNNQFNTMSNVPNSFVGNNNNNNMLGMDSNYMTNSFVGNNNNNNMLGMDSINIIGNNNNNNNNNNKHLNINNIINTNFDTIGKDQKWWDDVTNLVKSVTHCYETLGQSLFGAKSSEQIDTSECLGILQAFDIIKMLNIKHPLKWLKVFTDLSTDIDGYLQQFNFGDGESVSNIDKMGSDIQILQLEHIQKMQQEKNQIIQQQQQQQKVFEAEEQKLKQQEQEQQLQELQQQQEQRNKSFNKKMQEIKDKESIFNIHFQLFDSIFKGSLRYSWSEIKKITSKIGFGLLYTIGYSDTIKLLGVTYCIGKIQRWPGNTGNSWLRFFDICVSGLKFLYPFMAEEFQLLNLLCQYNNLPSHAIDKAHSKFIADKILINSFVTFDGVNDQRILNILKQLLINGWTDWIITNIRSQIAQSQHSNDDKFYFNKLTTVSVKNDLILNQLLQAPTGIDSIIQNIPKLSIFSMDLVCAPFKDYIEYFRQNLTVATGQVQPVIKTYNVNNYGTTCMIYLCFCFDLFCCCCYCCCMLLIICCYCYSVVVFCYCCCYCYCVYRYIGPILFQPNRKENGYNVKMVSYNNTPKKQAWLRPAYTKSNNQTQFPLGFNYDSHLAVIDDIDKSPTKHVLNKYRHDSVDCIDLLDEEQEDFDIIKQENNNNNDNNNGNNSNNNISVPINNNNNNNNNNSNVVHSRQIKVERRAQSSPYRLSKSNAAVQPNARIGGSVDNNNRSSGVNRSANNNNNSLLQPRHSSNVNANTDNNINSLSPQYSSDNNGDNNNNSMSLDILNNITNNNDNMTAPVAPVADSLNNINNNNDNENLIEAVTPVGDSLNNISNNNNNNNDINMIESIAPDTLNNINNNNNSDYNNDNNSNKSSSIVSSISPVNKIIEKHRNIVLDSLAKSQEEPNQQQNTNLSEEEDVLQDNNQHQAQQQAQQHQESQLEQNGQQQSGQQVEQQRAQQQNGQQQDQQQVEVQGGHEQQQDQQQVEVQGAHEQQQDQQQVEVQDGHEQHTDEHSPEAEAESEFSSASPVHPIILANKEYNERFCQAMGVPVTVKIDDKDYSLTEAGK